MLAPLMMYSGSLAGAGCASMYLMLSKGITSSTPSTSAMSWRAARTSFSLRAVPTSFNVCFGKSSFIFEPSMK